MRLMRCSAFWPRRLRLMAPHPLTIRQQRNARAGSQCIRGMMNKKTQVGVRNGLSVGVLIVGSLYWDLAPHRKDWRANRLNPDDERFVRAPIRYGRRSSTRGCSYTMVFSLGVVGADQSGRAIVVPCKHRAHGIDDLSREAECLWAAERKPGAQTGSLSADWGCVALLVNPNRAESEPVRKLSSGWTDRVSNERCYGQTELGCGRGRRSR